MERRVMLAIVLCVVVLFGYTALMKQLAPPRAQPKANPAAGTGTGDTPAVPGMANGNPGVPAVPAPPPGPQGPPKPKPVQSADPRTWIVEPKNSEWKDVGLTTRGGAIRYVRLKNAYEEAARDNPIRQNLDVLLPGYPDLLSGDLTFDEADTEQMRTLDWTIESESADAVAFSFKTTTGLKVKKTYTWPTGRGRYDLDLAVVVERISGAAPAGSEKGETATLRLLGAAGLATEPSSHTSMPVQNQVRRRVAGQDDDPVLEAWHIAPFELTPVQYQTRSFRLIGMASPYFASLLWSEGGEAAPRVKRVWADGGDAGNRDWRKADQDLIDFFEKERGRKLVEDARLAERLQASALNFQRAWVEFDVGVGPAEGAAGKPSEVAVFHVYAGPLSRTAFADDRYEELSSLITYPMAPDFVARFLLSVFDIANSLTGSAGLAVILMTLFVRGGMMPLSIRNQLSMRRTSRKMARVKPKLEALKLKFAKDPKRFREEQVKLYKAHGVGFPMGCIMLFLQIPIFMSLFSSLRIEYGVRHESFAWIHDLSGPDRLLSFGNWAGATWSFPPGGLRGLNLLPILYMALSIYQQRLMPKPIDEQQAQQMKMAKWMSIIFPVLLYNYTAALALYMVVSSTVAIVESRIVRAKDQHDINKAAEAAAG